MFSLAATAAAPCPQDCDPCGHYANLGAPRQIEHCLHTHNIEACLDWAVLQLQVASAFVGTHMSPLDWSRSRMMLLNVALAVFEASGSRLGWLHQPPERPHGFYEGSDPAHNGPISPGCGRISCSTSTCLIRSPGLFANDDSI